MIAFLKQYFYIWFPIFTLVFGILIQKFSDKIWWRLEIKRKGRKWLKQIEFYRKPIEKQTKALNVFLEAHNQEKFLPPHLEISSQLSGERLKSIDWIEFLEFLELKFKDTIKAVEIANDTFAVTEALAFILESIKTQFQGYLTRTSEFFHEWNTQVNVFQRMHQEMCADVRASGGDMVKDTFLTWLYDLYVKEIKLKEKNNTFDLFESQELFTKSAIQFLNLNSSDGRAVKLIESLRLASESIDKIKNEKYYLSTNLTHLIEQLEKKKNNLHYFINQIENNGMNIIGKDEFKTLFSETQRPKALKQAHDIRKFEIEMYWKRATYFWAFIAVLFAGYFSIYKYIGTDNEKAKYLLIAGALGSIISFAWYLVNRGSKHWQVNWERMIANLEDEVTGPIYKTTIANKGKWYKPIDSYPFSVSKLNQIVSIAVWLSWNVILVMTAYEFWPCSYLMAIIVGIVLILAHIWMMRSARSKGVTTDSDKFVTCP